jgi:hypothetical protein
LILLANSKSSNLNGFQLNRVERIGETLHATLNVLAVAAPEWVRVNIPNEWVDRYGKRVDEWRLPEEQKDREIYAQMVGRDGAALLEALWSEETPEWIRSLPAVETPEAYVDSAIQDDPRCHASPRERKPPSLISANHLSI